ncbi:hypothetical protein [Streptomyces sp. NBC_01207]|uniref:hypothetical protein n=1 Tax=Streptomyces sp. NBC_01207 TaxID=2903772 RepID=UPI002E144A2D|nr:hypothetical protein OG457_48270 [Streptomyces sp. NBC_01207]
MTDQFKSAVIRYDSVATGTATVGFHTIVNHDGPLANLTAPGAVLHLHLAEDVFGHGRAGDEPADDAREDL